MPKSSVPSVARSGYDFNYHLTRDVALWWESPHKKSTELRHKVWASPSPDLSHILSSGGLNSLSDANLRKFVRDTCITSPIDHSFRTNSLKFRLYQKIGSELLGKQTFSSSQLSSSDRRQLFIEYEDHTQPTLRGVHIGVNKRESTATLFLNSFCVVRDPNI